MKTGVKCGLWKTGVDCPHLGVIDIHVHVQDNPYLLLTCTIG